MQHIYVHIYKHTHTLIYMHTPELYNFPNPKSQSAFCPGTISPPSTFLAFPVYAVKEKNYIKAKRCRGNSLKYTCWFVSLRSSKMGAKAYSEQAREFTWTLLPLKQLSTCPDGFQKRNVWVSRSDSSVHYSHLTPGKTKDRPVTVCNGGNTQWCRVFTGWFCWENMEFVFLAILCWIRDSTWWGNDWFSCLFPSTLTSSWNHTLL